MPSVSCKNHVAAARRCGIKAQLDNRQRERTRGMVKDPVCGMTIDEKKAAGQSEYQGQTIYFCAPICKTKFDQDPARYMDRK
jgi:YHS domain-containing protein